MTTVQLEPVQSDPDIIFLKSRHTFSVDLKRKEFTGLQLFEFDRTKGAGYELAEWLFAALTGEMQKLLSDTEGYNRSAARRMSCRYRLGKISLDFLKELSRITSQRIELVVENAQGEY